LKLLQAWLDLKSKLLGAVVAVPFTGHFHHPINSMKKPKRC